MQVGEIAVGRGEEERAKGYDFSADFAAPRSPHASFSRRQSSLALCNKSCRVFGCWILYGVVDEAGSCTGDNNEDGKQTASFYVLTQCISPFFGPALSELYLPFCLHSYSLYPVTPLIWHRFFSLQ